MIENGWDAVLSRRYDFHSSVWRIYLQLRLKDEVIGQRYLREILTRLKFELSMSPALLACAAGLNWANAVYGTWSRTGMVVISIILIALSGFFLWESYQSAELLSRIRRVIVDAMRLDSAADLFNPEVSKRSSWIDWIRGA